MDGISDEKWKEFLSELDELARESQKEVFKPYSDYDKLRHGNWIRFFITLAFIAATALFIKYC